MHPLSIVFTDAPGPPSGSTANHLFPWFVYVSGCLPVLGAQSKLPNSIHVSTLLSRVFLKYLDKSTTNLSGLSTTSSTRAVSLNPPRTYYLEGGGDFCAHSGYPTPSSCRCQPFFIYPCHCEPSEAISPFPFASTSTRRLLRHPPEADSSQ